MRHSCVMVGAVCAVMMFGTAAHAQQTTAPPMPPAPPPVGAPVTIHQAKEAVAAALAEAKTKPYLSVFAVVDPAGSLVYFEKMDGAPYGSTEVAIGKARTSALFERPTKAFFDQMESGHAYVVTLAPGLVASIGGLPLVVDGKLVGAIGVSGASNPLFDQAAAQAGVDALK